MDSVLATVSVDLEERAEAELGELMQALPGLSAAVIATTDGFEVAASARHGVEVAKLAAMACSISALGSVVGDEGGVGAYQNVIIEAEEGCIVIVDVPHQKVPLILSLVCGRDQTLGQVIYMAKRTASRIAEIY